MDLDQVAQRLEEMSVDHDLPELADLAEALIAGETTSCGPECKTARVENEKFKRLLDEFGRSLHRLGIRIPGVNDNPVPEFDQYRQQQVADFYRYGLPQPSMKVGDFTKFSAP